MVDRSKYSENEEYLYIIELVDEKYHASIFSKFTDETIILTLN